MSSGGVFEPLGLESVVYALYCIPVTPKQSMRLTITNAVELIRGKVVPRQVFTPYDFSSVCCSLLRWLSRGNRCVLQVLQHFRAGPRSAISRAPDL